MSRAEAPPADGEGPIGIVAGGGRLPLEVAEAVEASGRRVIIAGIDGEADLVLDHPATRTFRWGQVGGAIDFMAAKGVRDVVFVGAIARRPDFKAMRLDIGTLRRVPKIVKALVGGDDSVVRKVLALIEAEGFRVKGIAEVAPALLVSEGTLGRHRPTPEDLEDAMLAMRALATLGPFDVGQSAVVVRGRIVAIEAAEGTDRMLQRVKELREMGRVGGRGGILVKRAKPGQDLRTELPTVGAATVAAAAGAKLGGIVLEAGRTIVADRPQTIADADAAGLFLHAVAGEEQVA
ncbi:LpxI family protein [Amorphus sp. 3PC139-8]|uniref:LpxI family protein n=1 Tax=Amorphus sp. 3PC139-8 TaxID=2735676 RepID=UPI00345D93A8